MNASYPYSLGVYRDSRTHAAHEGDLAYEILWNIVRILSSRLRETNDKMTFMSVSGKF